MKKRLIITAITTILLICFLNAISYAGRPGGVLISNTSEFDSFGGKIIGIIQAIGTITSILVLVVLGLKYMTGSVEERAEYKKTLVPYIIGAILLFAASSIAGAVYDFAQSI